jgi:hypothetical protein
MWDVGGGPASRGRVLSPTCAPSTRRPSLCEHAFVTSQGSAHGRFTRAIQQRNLWAAETSLRELGTPSLEDALAYLDLLAEQKPDKLERAAVRWHGRLETEAPLLTLAESQLALAALASLCAGERTAVQILRRLLRRVRPTFVPLTG